MDWIPGRAKNYPICRSCDTNRSIDNALVRPADVGCERFGGLCHGQSSLVGCRQRSNEDEFEECGQAAGERRGTGSRQGIVSAFSSVPMGGGTYGLEKTR